MVQYDTKQNKAKGTKVTKQDEYTISMRTLPGDALVYCPSKPFSKF